MKIVKIGLLLFVINFSFTGCKEATKTHKDDVKIEVNTSLAISKDISIEDFKNLLKTDSNIVILDVRPPEDFKAGHIPNALYLDWAKQDEFNSKLDSISKETTILVYCNSGHRSELAKNLLHKKEYQKVYNLNAGFEGWKKTQLPIEK